MTRASILGSSLLVLIACSPESPQAAVTSSNAVEAPRVAAPADALDKLDTRTPLPLLPMMANHQKHNMRDHLVAVQEIVAALTLGDFAGVERAAGRIGLSEKMGQMCTHMGAGAPGFTEQALHFHRTADRIGEAARERDEKRVLTELGATLQTCTSCHATWKQQVVDEAAWQSLSSASSPTDGAPH